MAVYPTLGTGPVSFVDATNFNQQELPLGQIFYSPNGWDVTTSPLYTSANQAVIDALLKQLAAQGFLVAASQALTQPVVTAVQAGAMGNLITVTLANVSLSAGTVDVTVTLLQIFSNLTPSGAKTGTTVSTVLGTSVATATGLAFVSDPGSGLMPGSYSGPVGAVPDTAKPTSATAFTLTPTAAAQAGNISVIVKPGATTFTLTVTWTLIATQQTIQDLLTSNPFSYLVTFGGQDGPLPANGTVTLTGGQDATGTSKAVAASASIYASS